MDYPFSNSTTTIYKMNKIILNGTDTTVRLERQAGVLPSQQQLLDFETALGYPLPADYKEFLLTYNGGVCELKNIIKPVSGYLCDLFGLFDQSADPGIMPLKLPASDELTELWGSLPSNLLPVGEVDSGDMIAMRFYPAGIEIVIVDHEDDQLNSLVVADSFTAFLRSTIREND